MNKYDTSRAIERTIEYSTTNNRVQHRNTATKRNTTFYQSTPPSTAQHSAAQYTEQHSTVQTYSTAQHRKLASTS